MKAKKSLGQNFLNDQGVLMKIINAADLKEDDYIVEVGPGKGVLTRELAKNVNRVTAIELDERMLELLKDIPGVELIHGDALKWRPPEEEYKVVANIPYYITSPLISHFLEAKVRPTKMVLLIQKEVAEKICAEPGKLNVLALHVQVFGKPRIVCKVSPGAFRPMPKVDSAVLEIDVYDKPLVEDYRTFFGIMHRAFSHKRKTLQNSLQAPAEVFEKAGIDPMARPQHLSIDEWQVLVNELQKA